MKLRFRVGRTHARTNGDIEALADAMRALKNHLPHNFARQNQSCQLAMGFVNFKVYTELQ
jgi:hypothetical protein